MIMIFNKIIYEENSSYILYSLQGVVVLAKLSTPVTIETNVSKTVLNKSFNSSLKVGIRLLSSKTFKS